MSYSLSSAASIPQDYKGAGGEARIERRKKLVGVRQRPSGRWVAEIKDTKKKIRMWLGTFQTAEEAAQAYDEAACLLRGSNTRTNFVPNVPKNYNPALASRITRLLSLRRDSFVSMPKSKEQLPPKSSSSAQQIQTLMPDHGAPLNVLDHGTAKFKEGENGSARFLEYLWPTYLQLPAVNQILIPAMDDRVAGYVNYFLQRSDSLDSFSSQSNSSSAIPWTACGVWNRTGEEIQAQLMPDYSASLNAMDQGTANRGKFKEGENGSVKFLEYLWPTYLQLPAVNQMLIPAMDGRLQSHADQRISTHVDCFLQRSGNLDSFSSQSNSSSAVPWNAYGTWNRKGNSSPSGNENLNNEGTLLDLLPL